MDRILEYQIIESISKNQNTEIFRAKNKQQEQVILKLLREEHANSEKLARFKKEYEITRKLTSEWTPETNDLLTFKNTFLMIFKDFGGISLDKYILQNSPCTDKNQLIDFIEIAILIVKALNEIHNQNTIHKDINPSNIVYNKEKKQLKIIDFGLATVLKNENFESNSEIHFEGTYAYISPEQTGRVNRIIDYRTDYYSLGITLYELFSGLLPFKAEIPREWIHSHIAKESVPLNKINATIPKEISDVVLKLMDKSADNRYQSAYGILKDLEKCRNDLQKHGNIVDFDLGKFDVSQKFRIPQKLYGRGNEINELLSFINSAERNENALLLVKGNSGIGKTSLIQEIQRRIEIDKKSFFTSGKFVSLQKNKPYHAFLQAINHLIKPILAEDKDEIKQWKQKFISKLNGNGQLITNLIPELKLIIGEQPELPSLPPSESQNRFFNTFKNLINAFTSKEHKLIVFLDDLQWADTASLILIEKLLINQLNGSLILIGTYRENEVDAMHPLNNLIDALKEADIKLKQLHIETLQTSEVQQMFTEVFSLDSETSYLLAELCIKKTTGTPFFIIELLKSLYQKNQLYFNPDSGSWIVEIDKIEKSEVTENVAELLTKNIKLLPEQIVHILKYAACIGSKFEVSLLHRAINLPWEDVISLLNKSVEASLIYPLSDQYRFAEYYSNIEIEYKFIHDRIHHEIYALTSYPEKKEIHHAIGQELLKQLADSNDEAVLYMALEQLNNCIDIIPEQEKIDLAKLNLKACQKSKRDGAFENALFFARTCFQLIDNSHFKTQYELAFLIHKELAEAMVLVGRFAELEQIIDNALDNANDVIGQAKLLQIRVQSYISQHQQPRAVKEAVKVLKLLNISFPKNPGKSHIIYGFIKISLKLRNIKSADQIKLSKMTEPKILTAMDLMSTILSASYYVNQNLFPLIVFQLIQNTLKYGISPKSPVAFITFGLIEWSMNKIDQGYLHGQIGMKMFGKLNIPEHWSQAACIYNSAVIWNEPIKDAITGLFDAYKKGMDTGDNEFAVASAAAGLAYKFYSGTDIQSLFSESKEYASSLAYLNQKVPFNQIRSMLQTLHHFIDGSPLPEELNGKYYDENEMLPHFIEVQDNASALDLYLKKMVLAFHFKKYQKALEIAKQGRGIVQDVAGLLLYALFHYYESLILLANMENYSNDERKYALKRIEKNQGKFKKWAQHNPINFENKYCLVEAEIEKINGNTAKAQEFYDKAISLSEKIGNLIDLAMANELAGLFWLKNGKSEFAQLYLIKAHRAYSLWGANAKAGALQNEFEAFIPSEDNLNRKFEKTKGSSSGSSTSSQEIDFETVLEAAKAISSEIILTHLIEKTLTIILEHAGAQKGLLLLKDEKGQLLIKAVGYIDNNKVKVELQSKEINESDLPITIIRYAERTKETIILNNASVEGDFTKDKYIKKHSVRSALIIPIFQQAKDSGILYLENNLSNNVFNQERVDVLTMLCTQAAISIENAQLYNSMEQKVKERTKEISEKNDQLKELIATKDKFFSIIAHDLKNPIGNLSNLGQLLSESHDEFSQQDRERIINIIASSSKKTFNLLENLLQWARSESGLIEIKPQKIKVQDLFNSNLNLIQENIRNKNLNISSEIDKHASVLADFNMLNTVFRNLLSNAIKFTPKGGEIKVFTKSTPQKNIRIFFKDNGVGMDEKTQQKIFMLDSDYSTKGTENESGTGLGLKLSKEFITKNNGNISVESILNEGSVFCIELPSTD